MIVWDSFNAKLKKSEMLDPCFFRGRRCERIEGLSSFSQDVQWKPRCNLENALSSSLNSTLRMIQGRSAWFYNIILWLFWEGSYFPFIFSCSTLEVEKLIRFLKQGCLKLFFSLLFLSWNLKVFMKFQAGGNNVSEVCSSKSSNILRVSLSGGTVKDLVGLSLKIIIQEKSCFVCIAYKSSRTFKSLKTVHGPLYLRRDEQPRGAGNSFNLR